MRKTFVQILAGLRVEGVIKMFYRGYCLVLEWMEGIFTAVHNMG